jgi:hypothetical protein
MCKYLQTYHILCHCTTFSVPHRCAAALRNCSDCPKFPGGSAENEQVMVDCGFCQEAEKERELSIRGSTLGGLGGVKRVKELQRKWRGRKRMVENG